MSTPRGYICLVRSPVRSHDQQGHGSRATGGGPVDLHRDVHNASGSPEGASAVPWAMAAQATMHCLTGCAIGEVLGMVIGTAAGLHNAVTVVLSVILAFVFGYGLTMRGVLRAGVGFRPALRV